MTTVKEAKNLICMASTRLKTVRKQLKECIGFAVTNDIISPIDFPDFQQSAMDGYGVFLESESESESERATHTFILKGEEQTGNISSTNIIQKGEAIRIFTGAKVPEGVNTVIQQEWVQKEGDQIIVNNLPVRKGLNIRPRGSQSIKGECILKQGTALNPAGVSLLAGLGFENIDVMEKPRVIIINTGKELVAPGSSIQPGQVYESNSFALNHALLSLHIAPAEIVWVDDEKDILIATIKRCLALCDLLLITGGVSVGDYDFVIEALEANAVKQIFHKVKQKPGKPLYFGKTDQVCVFGLPGNPASVLTCFYQYVIPCIRTMMGFEQTSLKQIMLPCTHPYEKKTGMTHFLKGRICTTGVEILAHQESYKMNTYAEADVLIEIEEQTTQIAINGLVKVYLLHT